MENRQKRYINRGATVSGKFYPGSRQGLLSELEQLFCLAKKRKEAHCHPQALISPHAGFIFSGRVAASAFNQIAKENPYKRVFVIASSHSYNFKGAAVFNRGNYETPLGEIKVDIELADRLIKAPGLIIERNSVHVQEHSLEVQLPFIQYKLGYEIPIVPIIMGDNNPGECKQLAKNLSPWFTPENLFVFSTDFSHYPAYADANEIDLLTAEAICSNKPGELLNVLEENKTKNIGNLVTSLCAKAPVLTLLYLTEGQNFIFDKIEYKNSGDTKIHGNKDRVVGYWAIAAYPKTKGIYLTEGEKKELLEKARSAIVHFIKTGGKDKITGPVSNGMLNEPAGAFVSIYINNELRGCIGSFAYNKTLNETVQDMAVSAACDMRFDSIGEGELPNMQLEISVLTPLKRVGSVDEIELGRHGIYIKDGFNTGTFLPQVAEKTGWGLYKLLGHCSRDKAGLGWDGWKTAELFTYEAVVFKG